MPDYALASRDHGQAGASGGHQHAAHELMADVSEPRHIGGRVNQCLIRIVMHEVARDQSAGAHL